MVALSSLDQRAKQRGAGGGEICRGRQFELLVESVDCENVMVDVGGIVWGRTRSIVADKSVAPGRTEVVDDLLAVSCFP